MAYFEKVVKRITTEESLINEMKDFLIKSGLFVFVEEAKDSQRTVFTMKHKDGKYFTFAIGTIAYDTTGGQTNIWTKVFVNKPTITSISVQDGSNKIELTRMSYCRNCAFSFFALPILNMYMVNTGSFVVFVFEVSGGVYVHHAVGKYDSYGGLAGGELAGGTQITLDNNLDTSSNGYVGLPHGTTHPFFVGWGRGSEARQAVDYAGSHIVLNNEYVVVSALFEWQESSGSSDYNRNHKRAASTPYPFVNNGTNRFNGRTPMYPLNWYAWFPLADIRPPAIPLFYTNEICILAINGIDDGSIVDDKWLCFPLIARKGHNNYTVTGNVGIAYKIK